MSLALTRGQAACSVPVRPAAVTRDYAEIASKFCILTLFSWMAVRLGQDAARTRHATGILLVASEAIVVALTLVRRRAVIVDRSWRARLLTLFSTFGPPLVAPVSAAVAPQMLMTAMSAAGLIVVVFAKLSLGRSLGLAPANRGVVSTGMYRLVRHPIYLGYLITHVAFAIDNPSPWNWAILAAGDTVLLFRAMCEERTLALDPQYRGYMQRVPWRLVPGIF